MGNLAVVLQGRYGAGAILLTALVHHVQRVPTGAMKWSHVRVALKVHHLSLDLATAHVPLVCIGTPLAAITAQKCLPARKGLLIALNAPSNQYRCIMEHRVAAMLEKFGLGTDKRTDLVKRALMIPTRVMKC